MKKYAVITGASFGIGKEFASQLSKKYQLVLVARNEEKLESIANTLDTHCETLSLDLSKEENCYYLCDYLNNKDVEVFINNAGFGDCGSFEETDLKRELNMIDLNIKAVHVLTKLMVKHMKTGYILNVASFAGLIPAGPYMATYYATKSYVTSFTRAISQELKEKKSSLYIGCLCPGPVNSEFNNNANVEFALKGISCKSCVSYTLKKMYKRKVVIIPTIKMKCAFFLIRLVPQSLYIKITGHQQKKKIGR
jgi:hypothetical protein